MKMVDVGAKAKTERVAIASGRVRMSTDALEAIREGRVEKRDQLYPSSVLPPAAIAIGTAYAVETAQRIK